MKRIEKEIDQEYNTAYNEVRAELDQNLVITFLGTASSGKTSAIKALFDVDLGDISPIAGSTKNVKIIPIADHVYIADAPGFGDIQNEVSQKAKEICDKTDIFIYIINAEGGYKQQEKEDYENLISKNENVLVVLNKIDLVRKEEQEIVISDIKEKMHVDDENFIVVSFNPLPQIYKEPINVDKVRDWIFNRLEKKGKELLLAKIVKEKDEIADKIILKTSIYAIIACKPFFLSIGTLLVIILQICLELKLAHIYGYDISKEKVKALIAASFLGKFRRIFFRQIEKIVPENRSTAGWIIINGTSTFAIGKTMKEYFKSGMSIPIEDWTKIANKYIKEALKHKDEFKNA